MESISKLRHKGYTSTPHWNEESGEYEGTLDKITDTVRYSGSTLEEAEEDFYNCVDDYCNMKKMASKKWGYKK